MTEDKKKKLIGFRQFVESEDKKPPVLLWYETNDDCARNIAAGIIEEGKTYQIDTRYSVRFDIGHQPNQKNHTHVYLKSSEVCVVNRDGTPSHGSAPFNTLPTKIQKKIKSLGLVESSGLLMETASGEILISLPLGLVWLHLLYASSAGKTES